MPDDRRDIRQETSVESGMTLTPSSDDVDRRKFLSITTTVMAGGLTASYGVLGAMGVRFLFPSGQGDVAWQFVAVVDEFPPGTSIEFTTPTGATAVVARREKTADTEESIAAPDGEKSDNEQVRVEEFIALSSVCPHLGCRVHWEPQNQRFFCPCHNGAFNVQGDPIAGPPAAAGQQLKRFPLMIDDGLLMIEVPLESVNTSATVVAASLRSGPSADDVKEA